MLTESYFTCLKKDERSSRQRKLHLPRYVDKRGQGVNMRHITWKFLDHVNEEWTVMVEK